VVRRPDKETTRMHPYRILCLAFSLALRLGDVALAHGQAQASSQPSVSSDDISVAEGLQLPTYGHIWALDTWKGIHELVRLRPPDTSGDDGGFSLKLRHTIEFKGEAAQVRVHDAAPQFFLRGVSGSDNGRSDLVVVRLNIEGQAAGEARGFPIPRCDRDQAAARGNDRLVPDLSTAGSHSGGVCPGSPALQSGVRRRRDFRLCHRPRGAGKCRSSALRSVPRLGVNQTRQ
jgi:hypothetical protein